MAVTIRGKTLPLPILQGGMGVGISLDRLAGAVAAAGGMGTISTAVCGFREPDFAADPKGANLRALAAQVRRAKELVEELSSADIATRAREIAQESAGVPQHKAVTKPDDVDLNQMTLFDTVKSDDIVREIEELQINEITPVEALNILSRMQSRLKNRWQEG